MDNMVMGFKLHQKYYTFAKHPLFKITRIFKVFSFFKPLLSTCLEVRKTGQGLSPSTYGSWELYPGHQALGQMPLSHPPPFKNKENNSFYFYLCMCIHVYTWIGYPKTQKKAWIPWGWGYRQLWAAQCGNWESKLGPLKNSQAVLTTESQLLLYFIIDY